MRINIYAAPGNRGVWREARIAARASGVSLSDFAASALRNYLAARRRRELRGRRVS